MDKNFYHKRIKLISMIQKHDIWWVECCINIGKFISFAFDFTLNFYSNTIEYNIKLLCISIHGHIYFKKLK